MGDDMTESTLEDLGPSSMRVQREAAPVRAQVANALRRAIAEQRFKPGERLRERQLCDLTGVSRTSVREALRQLEAEGLVEVTTQGPIVARITPHEAAELYQVRAVLEGLAGRLAAGRASTKHIEQLTAVIEQLAVAYRGGDYRELLQLKDRFYDVLFDAAGNGEVTRILDGLRARINFLRMTSLSEKSRRDATVEELHEVVGAIAAGDGEAAEAACQRHVTNAGHVVARLLGGEC